MISRKLEKQRYIAAAQVALSRRNWRQVIAIVEHILRLERAIETEEQIKANDSNLKIR